MSRLGIDLGTSGCTVSYWDRNTRAPEFYCRGLTETARIPAVISYGIRETVIGEAARLEEGKSETCAGFFVRLGRARELPLPGTSVTAGKAAADYLNVLLRHVREKLGAVEQMTVAVPAAWLRPEADNPLSPILRTLEIPANQVQFVSAAEASARAFSRAYRQHHPQEPGYRGPLLLADCGGGTLDLTLLLIEEQDAVRTLAYESCGLEKDSGCGGRAFLHDVIRRACGGRGAQSRGRDRALAVRDLEQFLLANQEISDELMEDYDLDPEDMANEVFCELPSAKGADVLCRHVMEAFDAVCRPGLENALGRLKEQCPQEMERAIVVRTGGFSDFYPIRRMLRKAFGSKPDLVDPRFPELFSGTDRVLAAAAGAVLMMEEAPEPDPKTVPYELGILACRPLPEEPTQCEEVLLPLIRAGARAADFRQIVWSDTKVRIWPEDLGTLRIYRSEDGQRTVRELTEGLETLFFPGAAGDPGNEAGQEAGNEAGGGPGPEGWPCELGISLTEDGTPVLHTRIQGGERSLPLPGAQSEEGSQ